MYSEKWRGDRRHGVYTPTAQPPSEQQAVVRYVLAKAFGFVVYMYIQAMRYHVVAHSQ